MNSIYCLNCASRSLLRTTCKAGLRQEWDKKKCNCYRQIFTKLKKENQQLEEIRRNYCACEVDRMCAFCDMYEELSKEIFDKEVQP